MPKHPDPALHAVRDHVRASAVGRGRVFRRSDLIEWGIPADTVVPMLRRGWWQRLHHGVYVDARDIDPDPLSVSRHLLTVAASIRALPEPAYAFGVSASILHGHPVPRDLPRSVQLLRDLGREGRSLSRRITARDRLESVRIRTHRIDPADVTVVDGIPTVVPALAAVSTAVDCTPDWAVAVMDGAAWEAPERIADMRRHADALQHLAGIGTVRAVIEQVRSGAQTPLETHSRLRLMRCGLAEPRLQVPYRDEDGLIGYVDMDFDDLGVIGEADGLLKYRTGADLIAEKRREDRLRRHRPVVRWDWERIWHDPQSVARDLRRAGTVAHARPGRGTGSPIPPGIRDKRAMA